MQKHGYWFARLIALVLVGMMLSSACIADEINMESVTHLAESNVALKVRRQASDSAPAGDSIPRGATVYVLDYGLEWCKVRTRHMEGWVKTQYLTNVRPMEGYEAPGYSEPPQEAVGELEPGFTTNESNFRDGYYAHALVENARIFNRPSRDAQRVGSVPMYKKLTVSEVSGDWSFVRYNGVYGYMLNAELFKWDRIDPYAGEIPGLDIWSNLVFVNRSVDVRDLTTDEVLQSVNPGSALCAGEKDAAGRYPVPYHRQMGYVREEDVCWVLPVVNWEEAQSGDLISAMTTFFAVGKSTLQYQGRNWNIHLASGLLSGMVLQPDQPFDMNDTIGPYKKSTGYKNAPVMSPHVISGYGGGTCQVNTTFYNATIQLPLLVTHRKVHADVGMYYVKQGFDAAVGAGDINLTMINTLPYAIRYTFLNSDGVLTCCIFKE